MSTKGYTFDEYRNAGNAAFRAEDWHAAEQLYLHAWDASEGRDFLSLCNLSAVHMKMASTASDASSRDKFVADAVEDAREATRVAPNYAKGYYRLAQALQMMSQLREALSAVRECQELLAHPPAGMVGGGVPADVTKLRHSIEDAWLQQHYGESTKTLGGTVEVRMCPEEQKRGKGVFTLPAMKTGQTLFFETPIVSHIEAGCPDDVRKRTCSHCLRSMLTPELARKLLNAPVPGRKLCDQLTELLERVISDPPPKPSHCPHCGETYCCDKCRDEAWERYHCMLCPASDDAKNALAEFNHLADKLGLTNPLVISKMVAGVAVDVLRNGKLLSAAMEPYSAFEWNSWPAEQDEQFCAFLKRVMLGSKFYTEANATAVVSNKEQVIEAATSVEMFRMLHGVLQRNASRVQPVSEVHMYLCSTLPVERVSPILSADWAVALAAGGTALFRVANTVNHSCAPNCQFASTANNHTLSVIAITDIAANEELLVSYIDETQPYEQRQKELRERYCFTCNCSKCSAHK